LSPWLLVASKWHTLFFLYGIQYSTVLVFAIGITTEQSTRTANAVENKNFSNYLRLGLRRDNVRLLCEKSRVSRSRTLVSSSSDFLFSFSRRGNSLRKDVDDDCVPSSVTYRNRTRSFSGFWALSSGRTHARVSYIYIYHDWQDNKKILLSLAMLYVYVQDL
jgi:hypothetical protein